MKVFLTGATGFVGTHAVHALSQAGHAVVALTRSEEKARRLFPDADVEWVVGELGDAGALRRGVAAAEVVVHVAGLTKAVRPEQLDEVNGEGTRSLLDATRVHAPQGARFLYVSSLAAAGPTRHGRRAVETDPPHPVSRYGQSKLLGEQHVRASELPWTIVRPPAVYGPRDVEFLRLFRVVARGWSPVFGAGDQELSLIFVEDLARAIAACVDLDFLGRTYYAAHPEIVTAREFAERIGRALDVPRLRTIRIPRGLVQPAMTVSGWCARLLGRATMMSGDKAPELLAEAWTCSTEALERDARWTAITDTTHGLAATAAWYRAQGHLSP